MRAPNKALQLPPPSPLGYVRLASTPSRAVALQGRPMAKNRALGTLRGRRRAVHYASGIQGPAVPLSCPVVVPVRFRNASRIAALQGRPMAKYRA
jgi:hypothetical protein